MKFYFPPTPLTSEDTYHTACKCFFVDIDLMYCDFIILFQTIVFIMISGQMWNHIRNPPYAHRNPQTGEIVSWTTDNIDKLIILFKHDTVKLG